MGGSSPAAGTLLASAHDVAREFRILTGLAGTEVPTPGVIGLVEDDAICDASVLVVEFVDGLVIDRMENADGLTLAQRRTIGLDVPPCWPGCTPSTSTPSG